MEFVSGNKQITKSISRSGGIQGRLLGNTFGNSLIKGTNSMGVISEFKYWTLRIWYKYPLEILCHAFKKEMIRLLGISFPPLPLYNRLIWKVKIHQPRCTIYIGKASMQRIHTQNDIKIKHTKVYQTTIRNSVGQHFWKISIHPFCKNLLTHG